MTDVHNAIDIMNVNYNEIKKKNHYGSEKNKIKKDKKNNCC